MASTGPGMGVACVLEVGSGMLCSEAEFERFMVFSGYAGEETCEDYGMVALFGGMPEAFVARSLPYFSDVPYKGLAKRCVAGMSRGVAV